MPKIDLQSPDNRHKMSDETKVGLVLLGVAALSLGAYALVFFSGFLTHAFSQ